MSTYICKKTAETNIEKIYEILSCWKCAIPLGQFTLFLGHFLRMVHPFSSSVSFVQSFLDSLVDCLHSPGKTKTKCCPNPNAGEFSFWQDISDQMKDIC